MKHAALSGGSGAFFGPLQPFESIRSGLQLARRGRRYPQGAHAVAVYATLRLRCGARLGVAPRTRFVRCAHYAQTGGAKSVLDARCARRLQGCAPGRLQAPRPSPATKPLPGLCARAKPRRHRNRPLRVAPAALSPSRFSLPTPPAFRPPLTRVPVYLDVCWAMGFGLPSQENKRLQRGRRHPVGAISGATSSAGLGSARASALPHLTRRVCLSGESEANAASSAARPQAEQHSGVGAQRRPPQHEPPPGAACRAAPPTAREPDVRESATGESSPFSPHWRFVCRAPREARWSAR